MPLNRATSVEINLDAFRYNLRIIKSLVGLNTETMAIIKADAYGHGAIQCARAAIEEGTKYLGVGIIQEGIELRESGITSPILILGGVYPDELTELIYYNLSTSLSTLALAKAISKKADQSKKNISVHIKIDTGMGRLGVQCEDFSDLLENVMSYKNITIEGFFTHLANADNVDPKVSQEQIVKFTNILKITQSKKFSKLHSSRQPILIHSANSAGLLRYPESRFNLVRPGISLYGSLPSPILKPVLNSIKKYNYPALRPVMSWKTKIIQVQTLRKGIPLSYGGSYTTQKNKSRIAILPVGYADGLNRRLSNKMEFLVKGTRVKQIGTICMDMCLIDVTELPNVDMGEEVVILGSQGKDNIPIEELAAKAETIPYEMFCGISKRVPRVYV